MISLHFIFFLLIFIFYKKRYCPCEQYLFLRGIQATVLPFRFHYMNLALILGVGDIAFQDIDFHRL